MNIFSLDHFLSCFENNQIEQNNVDKIKLKKLNVQLVFHKLHLI